MWGKGELQNFVIQVKFSMYINFITIQTPWPLFFTLRNIKESILLTFIDDIELSRIILEIHPSLANINSVASELNGVLVPVRDPEIS